MTKEKTNIKVTLNLTETHYKKIVDHISTLPYPVPVSSYIRQVVLKKIDEEQAKVDKKDV